jgi:hypothetical protein
MIVLGLGRVHLPGPEKRVLDCTFCLVLVGSVSANLVFM